jgi:hypothetical protein
VKRYDLSHVSSPNDSREPDADPAPREAEPVQDAEIFTRDQLFQREISAHQLARVRQRRKAQEVTFLLLKISEKRLTQPSKICAASESSLTRARRRRSRR